MREISLLLVLVFSSTLLKAENKRNFRVGVEFGASADFLFSDISNQAFGLGLGNQYGLSGTYLLDGAITPKVRIERVALREEMLTNTDSSNLISGTFLKGMVQGWNVISAGAEFRKQRPGHEFFWEILLGYAMANEGAVTVMSNSVGATPQTVAVAARSTFALSAGLGFRREVHSKILALVNLRTLFLTNSIYTGALENKAYIPLPLMFSVGAEMPF